MGVVILVLCAKISERMTSLIIQDYDPSWPQRFETLRARIAAALDGMVSVIEHVGSTAVPGLAAKPIIDIDVVLRSATDMPLAIARLASLGYEHRGDLGIPGREAFRTPPSDWPHHLYVCRPDSQEHRRHLLFRDHLRKHQEDANAYASRKRELAGKCGDDRERYTQGKSEFVSEILQRAGDANGR
jgi:GrpB-like predicted nucleotidyltransferase (UPF0157 family)